MPHRRNRWPEAVVVVLLLAGGTFVPSPARADLQSEREEVQRERAQTAAEIDTLRATDAEVEDALRTLAHDVETQAANLRDAERESAAAAAALTAATDRVAAKEVEIAVLEDALREVAVNAYMRSPESAGLLTALSSGSIGEAEVRRSLLRARSTHDLDVLDQLDRARDDLEDAHAEAQQAAAAAENRHQQVANQFDAVTEARTRQEAVVADVQERLDRRLIEAQSLAELDAGLAAKIEAEQARIAEELRKQREAQEAAAAEQAAAERVAAQERAAAERAAQRSATAPSPAAPPAPTPAPTPAAPPPPATIAITGSGSIVSVRGIRVHRSIADSLGRMLQDADAAGISLSGGGYRDPAGQIAVRRSNCGTSNYAVYQMPASSCSPPTARPGTSMHEQGLAIDFTHGGRIIRSRSSAAFVWLKGNAAQYGFYNLPSEPWHWSVNGR